MKRLLIAVPLAVAASVMAVPAAHADDRVCRGTIGASSLDGNVVVPQNATCQLNGTRVDGNIIVNRGAKLVASGVRVGGNLQAEGHREVVVRTRSVNGKVVRPTVEGSIQLKQGGGGKILRAVVGSDIQLFTNRGAFEVRGNRVDGNLQCKENSPRPVGGNNTVHGNKEDQCRGL